MPALPTQWAFLFQRPGMRRAASRPGHCFTLQSRPAGMVRLAFSTALGCLCTTASMRQPSIPNVCTPCCSVAHPHIYHAGILAPCRISRQLPSRRCHCQPLDLHPHAHAWVASQDSSRHWRLAADCSLFNAKGQQLPPAVCAPRPAAAAAAAAVTAARYKAYPCAGHCFVSVKMRSTKPLHYPVD